MGNNKYETAKVYKIWSTQGDKVYVGSTTKEYLSQRMVAHRDDYKRWKRGTHSYTTSFILFEEYCLDNCFIELLEAKSCSSKDELRQLEGKYIRDIVCVNKNIAGRTNTEYNVENKEHFKQYRKDNKDKTKQYNDKYREDNKHKIKELGNKYRENNKEKISDKKKEKCICECGSLMRHSDEARHLKTIKHCQFIEA
jgi:DNA replication protein DnaD